MVKTFENPFNAFHSLSSDNVEIFVTIFNQLHIETPYFYENYQ